MGLEERFPIASPESLFDEGAVLLVDKPSGWTSFDVVNKIRRLTGARRVGHAGTLDPFATGLLILCTGRATKRVSEIQDCLKSYRAIIEFGKETDTLDVDGTVIHESAYLPSEHEIRNVLGRFSGVIQQVPPAYSAIKVAGKRAYKAARRGETVTLNPREVAIHSLQLLKVDGSLAEFEITCSKGTYIRSLARDIAVALGSCGYVRELRRTAIGSWGVEQALTMDQWKEVFWVS